MKQLGVSLVAMVADADPNAPDADPNAPEVTPVDGVDILLVVADPRTASSTRSDSSTWPSPSVSSARAVSRPRPPRTSVKR